LCALRQLADRRVNAKRPGRRLCSASRHTPSTNSPSKAWADADDVAMIGDDEADVSGAMVAGSMGLLVQTGKYRPARRRV
jgi:phosphoglycolate phosphatase-like HAD superfamily hydrolase